MSDTSIRKILMLQRVPRFPRVVSTLEMKSYLDNLGYEVSLRTIQRDFEALSSQFPIFSTEYGGNVGNTWSFDKNAPNILPYMDPATALIIKMAGQFINELLPDAVLNAVEPFIKQSEEVLNKYDRRGFSRWSSKVRSVPFGMNLSPAHLCESSLHGIHEALLEDKQILCTYSGKKEQRVHPLGLVHRGRVSYLICRFFDYDDVRVTLLHKYSDVKILDSAVTPLKDFDLGSFVDSGALVYPYKNTKTVKLVARFNKYAGKHLYETPLNETQRIKILEDGNLELRADVLNNAELEWWLLGFADGVEVISPKSLRVRLLQAAQAMVEVYK